MELYTEVAAFEKKFTVHPCLPEAYAPTGEPYIAFCTRFRVDPESEFTLVEKDELIAMFMKELSAYANKNGGRNLYWRERPFLAAIESGGTVGMEIYGRLCISKMAPTGVLS